MKHLILFVICATITACSSSSANIQSNVDAWITYTQAGNTTEALKLMEQPEFEWAERVQNTVKDGTLSNPQKITHNNQNIVRWDYAHKFKNVCITYSQENQKIKASTPYACLETGEKRNF